MTLDKKDLQKYFKRLRKLEKKKIKYYACGEYGGKRKRPHYHIILFNTNAENIVKAWTLENKPIGNVFLGDVRGESVTYVLDYMSKPKTIPEFKNDDRQKEKSLMSKFIGVNYLSENIINWHHADLLNRLYVPHYNLKLPMPRYYKNKLYDEKQKKLIAEKCLYEKTQKEIKLRQEHGEHYESVMAEIHLNMFRKLKQKAQKRWNKELQNL